jgi:hypothetical protein
MKKLLLLFIIVFTFSSCKTWTCSACLETQYSSTRYISNSGGGIFNVCSSVEDPNTHLFLPVCKDCCRKQFEHLEKSKEDKTNKRRTIKEEILQTIDTTFTDGGNYVGEWKNDMANGQGTFTYANGDKYVGEWKDGKKHGQGTYIMADGGNYVGEWKNDMANGQGTYTYVNGDKYVGEFKDDKKYGQGTYTMADGTVYKGLWENDEFLGE